MGELIQIIGRARGVNRTANDPVDVFVLTDSVLPLPLTEILSAKDLDPNPWELMLGCKGIALENARHASRAFQDLWDSHDAARKAFTRSAAIQGGTFPYIKYTYTRMSHPADQNPLRRVSYQLAGARQQPSIAWVDPTVMADPEKWLTDEIGLLASFKYEAEPEAPAAEPTPEPPPMELILPPTQVPVVKRRPWMPHSRSMNRYRPTAPRSCHRPYTPWDRHHEGYCVETNPPLKIR